MPVALLPQAGPSHTCLVPTAPVLSPPAIETVQRRTVRTLVGSQMFGGLGVASGIAVSSLMAEQILGSPDLAGLANTAQVLGAALMSIPAARLMAARGRRVGLVTAYLTGIVGAALAIAAALLSIRRRPDPLLLARQVAMDAGETERTHGSVRRGLHVIRQNPLAMLGIGAVAIGHTVMVSVMVMTPLHLSLI